MSYAQILPALSGASELSPDTAIRFLNMALGVVSAGIAVTETLSQLNAEVAFFVAEGRDPDPDEWSRLEGRSDVAHDRIQSARQDG